MIMLLIEAYAFSYPSPPKTKKTDNYTPNNARLNPLLSVTYLNVLFIIYWLYKRANIDY